MAKPVAVDFTGVESGGGRVRIPEDDYKVRVVDATLGTAKSSGNSMIIWNFEIIEGKFKGKKLRDRAVLTPESLWKLKQILEAMGLTVPSKKVALDLTKYVGKELGATVVDDEYEGKISSKIADYVSVDVLNGADVEDEEEDDDEEEEPVTKKSKKGKKKAQKVEDEDDDDDIEELDLDGL